MLMKGFHDLWLILKSEKIFLSVAQHIVIFWLPVTSTDHILVAQVTGGSQAVLQTLFIVDNALSNLHVSMSLQYIYIGYLYNHLLSI